MSPKYRFVPHQLTALDGASLIYTSKSAPNSLPTLIHSTLGIHSPLKKQSLKHNIIDRDKVLVPPNWDSWGKIRVLREGFDVEGVNSGWSLDIQTPPPPSTNSRVDPNGNGTTEATSSSLTDNMEGAVLHKYETTITNPRNTRSNDRPAQQPQIEVSVKPAQEFLAQQLETLTHLQAEDEKAVQKVSNTNTANAASQPINRPHDERVNEHIGPVQVNMGGIQVDADDVVKKLENRKRDHASKTHQLDTINPASAQTAEEQKAENEKLSSFFANLAKRGASGSPRNTPGKEARSMSGKETPSKRRD